MASVTLFFARVHVGANKLRAGASSKPAGLHMGGRLKILHIQYDYFPLKMDKNGSCLVKCSGHVGISLKYIEIPLLNGCSNH